MMLTRLAILGWCGLACAAAGDGREVRVAWSGLGARVTGREVVLELPAAGSGSGCEVGGVVREVRAQSLVLRIRRSTAAGCQGKGDQEIPRDHVKMLRMPGGRGPRVALAILAGGAAGGYYLGKRLSRDTVLTIDPN